MYSTKVLHNMMIVMGQDVYLYLHGLKVILVMTSVRNYLQSRSVCISPLLVQGINLVISRCMAPSGWLTH